LIFAKITETNTARNRLVKSNSDFLWIIIESQYDFYEKKDRSASHPLVDELIIELTSSTAIWRTTRSAAFALFKRRLGA
jgi:hypothetical protein